MRGIACRLAGVVLAIVGFAGSPAWALQADELLLLVNGKMPESRGLADRYAQMRSVPAGRILALDLPVTEEMTFEQYERDVVPAVRAYLKEHHLQDKVKCIVPFYGVPFRIRSKVNSQEEQGEQAALRDELPKVREQIRPIVESLEQIVKAVDPAFAPARGQSINDLAKRTDDAFRDLQQHSAAIADPAERAKVLGQVVQVLQQLAGLAAIFERFGQAELANPNAAPAEREKWLHLRNGLLQARESLEELASKRYDATARDGLRKLTRETLGLFQYARLLEAQLDYFQTDSTVAAFDSELALLWWTHYPRKQWVINPLHHQYRPTDGPPAPPVVMVMRLDAPDAMTVLEIMVQSIKAEQEGLQGRIVLDSRGIAQAGANGKPDGYGQYDQTIRNLAQLLQAKSKLPLTIDDKPDVFGKGSVKDVAVYCGWYSVRNYVPAFTFNPGAVGFHIASLEMISLRSQGEKGWVRGMLNDGVAATLGPVAEPYLHAFPRADEYFPLLLTGKLTLAEVYWKTQATASWMVAAIGDPLYTPYKTNPELAPEDLPEVLRPILGIDANSPATRAVIQAPAIDGR